MELTLGLLLGSIIIILCILFNKVSNKAGVPMLLGFIMLGMIFGSDGLVKINFANFKFAEDICSASLIFIMFYGGFGTKWDEARKVSGKSLLLSSFGVIITAIITGLFCNLVLKLPFLDGMLIGSVLSSTDAASVFSILRSKRLNLKYGTASMLEMESGSNDPFSYMMTVIVLAIMSMEKTGGSLITLTISQLFWGVICGFVIAIFGEQFLRRVKMETDGFEAIFVFALALFGYAFPAIINGNGYLSVYIVGIYLGNSKRIPKKKELVNFFNGVTSLTQVIIFFILGLLAFPSKLPQILPLSVTIALFLTFVARPLAVFGILAPFKGEPGQNLFKQKLLISWAGLRGASSIVFAIMAVVSGNYMKYDIYHIVFTVVLLSITFQGTLIPFFSKRLDMIDENADVMKTFTDYSEENEIQFIKVKIDEASPWKNKLIKEIELFPNTLIAMIMRKKGAAENIDGDEDKIIKEKNIVRKKYFQVRGKIRKLWDGLKEFKINIGKFINRVMEYIRRIRLLSSKTEKNEMSIITRIYLSVVHFGYIVDHSWTDVFRKKRRSTLEVVPNGNTRILVGDEIVICAEGYNDNRGIELREVIITRYHDYYGKEVCDLDLENHTIILVIKRNGEIIVPTGDTGIREDDVLVINHL